MDCYKFELNNRQLKKAARRLWEQGATFRIIGTAIVVLAERETRNKITTIFYNLQVAPIAASDWDIESLLQLR